MKIETYKSEKWIEFKARYGISKKIEMVDVANAFYAGYGEGYAKSSEDSYSESEKASMILNLRQQIEKLQAELAEKDKAISEAEEIIIKLTFYAKRVCGENRLDLDLKREYLEKSKDWLEKNEKQKDEVK
jgi:hypothetical protein